MTTVGITQLLLLVGTFTLVAIQFIISRLLGHRSGLQIEQHRYLTIQARKSRQQVEELFAMTDMLQSAENHEDAGAVLEATSRSLLPSFSGALYVFNNSRDRLDLAKCWGHDGEFDPADALLPSNCWALKRGKVHVNDMKAGSLCCTHHVGTDATIEVPMVARGTIHGLLMFGCPADTNGKEQLKDNSRIARALADSMSLALSNIALREKLRTQSLRDPLTGLYNRRYMEDSLERYLSMAERDGDATSAIMIDLDHFKALNDKHGHAKGDAVLRDVAGQLVGGLRPSDVVCRYGGEEILVILPKCSLDEATGRAEFLRAAVEALSGSHGAAISASFGVASVPETSNGPADLVAMADAALYQAKRAGRNCVQAALVREEKKLGSQIVESNSPRLAVG
ncbi:GGDEF domain-containing protein [Alteraurantiacibacter aestuarii]|uniref:diguanylate cyclase n=1 Tax=Alteraurantiacibacter aestuarii TaxID=650004 RepID=A0A844ZMP2_9SPHN|nr:GGDEF domain-containing protein [Alteraurantiacibacter aestuarii]MXO89038.1 diguanylate cyclase [Alteraurantiacibacter aestuarii]